MRFTAVVDDPIGFEAISQACKSVLHFSRDSRITLRILPDCIYLVCANGLHLGNFMEIKLLESEIFTDFKMEGYSEERNMIIMELNGLDFSPLFQDHNEILRLKLLKRNHIPMLGAELKHAKLVKMIPLNLPKSKQHSEYLAPAVNPFIIGMNVNPLNNFENVINTFHEAGIDILEMKLLPGEIHINGMTESSSTFSIIFEDLPLIEEDLKSQGPIATEFFRVKVSTLRQFFNSLPSSATTRFSIQISNIEQIVFKMKHLSLEYYFYMSALRDEAEFAE